MGGDRVLTLPSPEELAQMDAGELDRALVEAERHRRMIEAVLIDVLDEADRRRVFAADGHVSTRMGIGAHGGVVHGEPPPAPG